MAASACADVRIDSSESMGGLLTSPTSSAFSSHPIFHLWAVARGLDFDSIGLCNTWLIRDSCRCGQRTQEIWLYFSHDPVACASLHREEPVVVAACWNGATVTGTN
ncbi:hypothetical protein DFH06DRAFT_1352717 [Mycena polygramma]|nr:hypothetical protein DFH06DRAFT_1352717 [Mycena polygramma]